MKFFLTVSLCVLCAISSAQKKIYAKLQLIYPVQLTYDTLLIKDSKGKAVSEMSTLSQEGKTISTYSINVGSITDGSFSIYFGGSLSKVNDTLYFESHGKDLAIELKDSFALRNRINLRLRNVYNFDVLYNRYTEYCASQMHNYDSLFKNISDNTLSRQQYLLKIGFDFVKNNVTNPFSADLFSVFVINPPFFYVGYKEANEFYTKYLKPTIKDPKVRSFAENKIEKLKHSLDEGNKAPLFSARSIHNQLINNEELSGKNVLLVFWATWCGPCMKEIPFLKQINEEYKGDNLVMVSVSLDTDSLKMVNVIKEKKLDWMQIFNNRAMIESFRINPIPAIFLINEKGIIIYNSISKESGTEIADLKLALKQKFKN